MKKILLSMFACLLSASAVSAQQAVGDLKSPKFGKTDVAGVFSKASADKTIKKAPKKLKNDQRYLGLSGADTPYSYYNVSSDVQSIDAVASFVPSSLFSKYVGAKVVGMRFAGLTLPEDGISGIVGAYNETSGSVSIVAQKELDEVTSCELNGQQLTTNWNEVMFDQPVEITSDMDALLVGYTTANSVPNVLVGYGTGVDGWPGALYLGTTSQSSTASWMGFSNYTLMTQLIIEKTGGFTDDLTISDFKVAPFAQSNGTLNGYVTLKNWGSNPLKTYSLDFTLDGKTIHTEAFNDNEDYAISNDASMLPVELPMPALAAASEHTIGVKVASMNGGAPTGDTSDDAAETTTTAYDQHAHTQASLLEHFTSSYCTNCPNGYELLTRLTEQRPDLKWVAIHGDMSTGSDELTIDEGAYYSTYMAPGYPSAAFNRYYCNYPSVNSDGMPAVVVNYGSEDKAINQGVQLMSIVTDLSKTEIPSFVTLNPTVKFTKNGSTSGTLEVSVEGTGVANAHQYLNDCSVTAYIVQDGLTGRQLNGRNWVSNFAHRNTLRGVITNSGNPAGDLIEWNGDNFTWTASKEIPAEWYADGTKLNVIVFVSKRFWDGKSTTTNGNYKLPAWVDADKGWVNQCVELSDIKEGTTAVNGIVNNDANASVVARFAANGAKVSAPVKGLNIVKMSDGSVRKFLVK